LKLRAELGRKSSVAIVNHRAPLTQASQLTLQSIGTATECVSFSDKTLNCIRCFEEQALNITDGIQPVNLRQTLGFAHDKPCCPSWHNNITRQTELEETN
jgi:hypothetical protein